jgi:hypothetical protein
MITNGTSDPGNVDASGSQMKTFRSWQIAAKLLPSLDGGQPIRIDCASDQVFQAWVEAQGLLDLIDDNGIATWSFDDRIRVINGAIRRGRALSFAGETIPVTIVKSGQSNSDKGIVFGLFDGPKPA